ncbi:site-specific integrase [Teredinibacter turnerae]|uniref:site-specific integrase n=1 Tax=Teredinibacter turnerae TaxID=2426 RepID=UPI00036FFF43|nr:site-specific integrase [Teredinibacter turnerae]
MDKNNAGLTLRNEQAPSTQQTNHEELQKYLRAATADNTRKTYQSAIRQFEKWGGRLPTERETVVRYLLDKASALNPRTLSLHLTAISQWHYYQGFADPVRDPVVRKTLEGITRTHARPKQKAKALRLEHIAHMTTYLRALPKSKQTSRDLALLLVGFFGAFRRSELVAIQLEHLVWEPEGVLVRLPRSKTDQSGSGLMRALPASKNSSCCPVVALKEWIKIANLTDGHLFRRVNRWGTVGDRPLAAGTVNERLKAIGEACGFDFVPDMSSHSLRRGLSTSAARERVDFALIKKQGGWRSDSTVWEYIEEGQQFDENAANILLEKMARLVSVEN